MLQEETAVHGDLVRKLAGADRLLLGCDFDGTLAPIVGDPAAAGPLPGAVQAMTGLAQLPDTHVAVVSGRARGDLAKRLGDVPGVILIGSHGAEWGTDFAEALTPGQTDLLRAVVRDVRAIVAGTQGPLIEQKPASVAVHVRQASSDDARRILRAVAEGPARRSGVAVINGKEVVELAVAEASKGQAVARLRELVAPTLTVFVGDDATDEAAFAALDREDVGVKVGPGESLAGDRLDGPVEVVALLAAVLNRRRGARRSDR